MSCSTFYLVSDEAEVIRSTRDYCEANGLTLQVFSPSQWNEGLESEEFRYQVKSGIPSLVLGASPLNEGAKVLQFRPLNKSPNQVQTINELEKTAIEDAIHKFKGNLTEAAKALGIGRATLYRKVKHYQIDPSEARSRKTLRKVA